MSNWTPERLEIMADALRIAHDTSDFSCLDDYDACEALRAGAAAMRREAALLAFYRKVMKVAPLIDGVIVFAAVHNHKWPEGPEHNWQAERDAVEALLAPREAAGEATPASGKGAE